MEEVGYIILKHIITQRTECYNHTHTKTGFGVTFSTIISRPQERTIQ